VTKILIARIGRGRVRWADEAAAAYLERLRHYTRVEESLLAKADPRGSAEAVREEESRALLGLLDRTDRVITLDERGASLSTPEFARRIERAGVEGARRVVFLLGGPHGHAEAARERAHLVLSLSPLVLNHEVARIVLLEQLYRAFTILRNEPYHHA
jgi:23S rRNA (pseudouridine1915-N3)-methyltransferase